MAPTCFYRGRYDHNNFNDQREGCRREPAVQQGEVQDDAQRLQNCCLMIMERLKAALPSSSFQGAIAGTAETSKRFVHSKQKPSKQN